jgi:hypothetical protein
MALVNNGVKLNIPSALIPSGFIAPAVTEFTDFEYKRDLNLNILKATVENVSKATTLLNIINDAAIGISKQVLDIMTADYIGTNTVTFYTELISLSNNQQTSVTSNFFGNVPLSYVAKVIVYVKTA